ncbi:uncharacterized protein C5orf34 homolog [Tubulanus polymorphus]|uniref:uncharacterized protein C5orf34 homolog n=1 Tax=Tubulanus polymorphus TaxID=672921 RepID=UPI003DA40875
METGGKNKHTDELIDEPNQLVLFSNDNIEAGFLDGCKVQLSSCAICFVHDQPIGKYAHPLQEMSRVAERTEYVTSRYKMKMANILEFRNRFAERPYLCPNIIPQDEQITLYEDVTHVCWPVSLESDDDDDRTSADVIEMEDGSLRIVSIDDHAAMTLSAHGRDFSVSFLAKMSQPAKKRCSEGKVLTEIDSNTQEQQDMPKTDAKPHYKEKNSSCDENTSTYWRYTWVVQHHLVVNCPPIWKHPLQLLTKYAEYSSNSTQDISYINRTIKDISSQNSIVNIDDDYKIDCRHDDHMHVATKLPVSLPLRWQSPHPHKWRPVGGAANDEMDAEACCFNGGVKVICSEGIIYRFSGEHKLSMEIYPGDGSVMISKGCNADYFTHLNVKDGQVEERTYCVAALPPEGTGSSHPYSIKRLISRGQRLLCCSTQAKLNLSTNHDSICWQVNADDLRMELPSLLEEERVTEIGHFRAYSSGRVRVLFTDRISLDLNFDIERLQRQTKEIPDSWSVEPFLPKTIRLLLRSGQYYYVNTSNPQQYCRYIDFTKAWITWVMSENRTEFFKDTINGNQQAMSVQCELQKIKCFNYLLDNLTLSTATTTDSETKQTTSPSWRPIDKKFNAATVMDALRKTSQAIRDIDSVAKK